MLACRTLFIIKILTLKRSIVSGKMICLYSVRDFLQAYSVCYAVLQCEEIKTNVPKPKAKVALVKIRVFFLYPLFLNIFVLDFCLLYSYTHPIGRDTVACQHVVV